MREINAESLEAAARTLYDASPDVFTLAKGPTPWDEVHGFFRTQHMEKTAAIITAVAAFAASLLHGKQVRS